MDEDFECENVLEGRHCRSEFEEEKPTFEVCEDCRVCDLCAIDEYFEVIKERAEAYIEGDKTLLASANKLNDLIDVMDRHFNEKR